MIDLLDQWGIWFLPLQAVAVAVTAFVPVLPSEAMVVASGAMSAAELMPLWAAAAATLGGCFLGDLGLYLAFRYQLIRVLHRWRWGRGLHRVALRSAIRAGRTNTWIGLLLIRWLPGGRTASMVSAAMMRIGWAPLFSLVGLGSVIWSTWLIGLGYITGTTTGLPPIISTLMGVAVGTLVGLIIAWVSTRRRRVRTQV